MIRSTGYWLPRKRRSAMPAVFGKCMKKRRGRGGDHTEPPFIAVVLAAHLRRLLSAVRLGGPEPRLASTMAPGANLAAKPPMAESRSGDPGRRGQISRAKYPA